MYVIRSAELDIQAYSTLHEVLDVYSSKCMERHVKRRACRTSRLQHKLSSCRAYFSRTAAIGLLIGLSATSVKWDWARSHLGLLGLRHSYKYRVVAAATGPVVAISIAKPTSFAFLILYSHSGTTIHRSRRLWFIQLVRTVTSDRPTCNLSRVVRTDFTDLNLYCIKGALALVVLVSFSGYVC